MVDYVLAIADRDCGLTREQIRVLTVEIRRLRNQVAGHAERIAAQSELLSRRAEKRP